MQVYRRSCCSTEFFQLSSSNDVVIGIQTPMLHMTDAIEHSFPTTIWWRCFTERRDTAKSCVWGVQEQHLPAEHYNTFVPPR